MKIGEFAKACNTRISVLRHYDSEGLLKPVYIDRFTEYRYYDSSQILIFEQISKLKAVGFSLAEIRDILYSDSSTERLFEQKKAELEKQLHDLEKLKTESGGIIMKQEFSPLIEDTNIEFENDESVIGKWEVVGENIGDKNKIVYFLPNGEFYWCFGWSRGKFIYDDGVSRFINDYRLEERGDELYMIISFKSQDHKETGKTTAIALRKLDSVHYTKEQIARKDDINKPFIPDEKVLGRWKAFCFIDSKDEFIPYINPPKGSKEYGICYFKEIEFKEDGKVKAVYEDEIIDSSDKHTWTRGYWLRKWNSCACAYEIKEFDGKEYLIIEWKSGDYRFGGSKTDYYVMVRG